MLCKLSVFIHVAKNNDIHYYRTVFLEGCDKMKFIGEIAALATAFFFALTALIFTSTGRAVGSQVTNRMRLTFALIYLVILNVILFRQPLPLSADSSRWL